MYTADQINKTVSFLFKKLEVKVKESEKLKETLSNVLLAYSKQRKEFNIPVKPEAVLIAEKLLKKLK